MIRFLKYAFIVPVTASLFYISSCSNDKAAEMIPAPIDTLCIPDGYTVTYTNDIKTILETYCTNKDFGICHQSDADNGSGFPYTTYEGIALEADGGLSPTLYHRVFEIGDMPSIITLGPQELSACDAAKLESWIENGAPE